MLEDKVVIVTGAATGIGYAVTRRLVVEEGATVIAVGRRQLYHLTALGRQLGDDRLQVQTADMSEQAQAQATVAQALERYGRVDGFIHAVHRALRVNALEVTDAEFDLTMQVNVKSALYVVQALAPSMRRHKSGGIVVYNPVPAKTPRFEPSEAVYAASTQALSALAEGWERQLASCNVSVREIAPSLELDHVPHDELLSSALCDALCSDSIYHPGEPVILTERGGLALTRF